MGNKCYRSLFKGHSYAMARLNGTKRESGYCLPIEKWNQVAIYFSHKSFGVFFLSKNSLTSAQLISPSTWKR